MNASACVGCYNNFYNGNNDLGVAKCWLFDSAKMEKKYDIPTMLSPPYKGIPLVSRPSCYKAKGYVRVGKDVLTKEGYWK